MLRRLSCLFIVLVASTFISSYTYMTDVKPTNTQPSYRIGYSTSYSKGQFNSTQYNSMVPKSYYGNQPYRRFENRGIYTGTYTPASSSYGSYGGSSSYGGSHGQPRRISVHNGQGGTEETPGGNSDNPNWLYQYDETTDTWWCSKDGGLTWQKWDTYLGWGLIGWSWRPNHGDPTEDAIHYHSDPTNPWVTPIGDGVGIMLFLAVMMAIYNTIKDKRRMSQRNSW